jgi:acyl-CoA synthetase (AMP-forming)/AMP-acid ligase II
VLRPTYTHPRASEYEQPGGAWDIPSLDALMTNAVIDTDQSARLVVDGDIVLRAEDLWAGVAKLAAGLQRLGVQAGDVVTWQLPNCADAVLLYRSCWKLGAIAAPVHHQASALDAAAMLTELQPRAVFGLAGSSLLDWLGAVEVGSGAWDVLFDTTADGTTADDTTGDDISWEQAVWRDGTALAAVLHTAGSSGAPKAVLHSQRTLAYKAAQMAAVHGLGPGDCVLMPAPLAHVSGLLNGITLPGAVPFRSVLMRRWDPALALDLIEAEQVTFMIGPPTFFVSLMHAPGFSTERVASLRLVSSGGAGVTEAFVADASQRLGCVVKRTYGSTEAPTIATSRPGDDPDAARRFDGRAIGAVELRIDTNGELLVRGPEVCCGYIDAAQTAGAFTAEGWFRTGDLGALADGWLTIVGRIKDVIIRGGENISAAEVENVLESHPDVRQAVVVGYPDELMGERVGAFVVAPATFDLDAAREWCGERGLARYKSPERVFTVDALPLLATGKPDRGALRERALTLSTG